MLRSHDPDSPYWGLSGSGGNALEMGTQALEPYERNAKRRESIYRSFFRYAVDLLFDGLGVGWKICDADGTMLAPGEHGCIQCKGPMRPITWEDLKRKARR